MPSQCSFRPKTLKALVSLVGVRRFSSHIHVLGPMGSTRFASWLKFAPGEFVILGVLPATLRVALRSKIALSSASCLAKNPAFAIHGYGVRRAEAVLRLFPPHPGDFVNFRPLPPEGIWAFISSCY